MEGFQYGDIIVIGAIAAFIILRYRAMLGDQSGRDPAEIKRSMEERMKAVQAQMEPVVKLADRKEKPENEPVDPDADFSEMLAISFRNIRQYDPDFTPQDFLGGARTAFEMVIKAFNERDHETLSMLLAKNVYANFSRAIDEQTAQGLKQETTLVSIRKADITHAQVNGKIARLTVTFDSEQIHLIRDAEGNVKEGNPSDVDLMDDEWIFERDLGSSSPNWLIIET